MVSLLFILMEPVYLLSENDSLLRYFAKEINRNQKNERYLDSLSGAIFRNYSLDNPSLFSELSPQLFAASRVSASKKTHAWSLFYLGFYKNTVEEYTEAVYNLEEALSLFREVGYNLLVAYTYNQLGLSYFQQGNLKTATEYLTKALAIYDQQNYSNEKYALLTNLGILHLNYAPDKSIEYFLAALNSAKSTKNNANLSLIYIQLVKAYLELKDYDKAEQNLQLCKDNNIINKSIFVQKLILLYQANIYKGRGDYLRALKNYHYLVNNAIFIESDYLFAIYSNIAEIHLKQGNYQEAINYFQFALANDSKQMQRTETGSIFEGLSTAYSKVNKIDSAITYFNLYMDFRTKALWIKKSDESQKFLFDYELNKKELEIQKVLLENKKQENQFKNFIIIAAGLIIVVLLILITFYYKSYKRNYSLSLRLQSEIEQNEKFKLELIEAKQKIEETDSFKSAIIRNMTHEIRTPFNGLLGFVSLMRKRSTELDDEELIEYSELVELSGRRVYELVSNLNDLALLESNDYQLHFGISYLPDIINEVYFQHINIASNKGLEIRVGKIDDIIFDIDSAALSKALKNVVDNAIKFTSNGFVSIDARQILDNLEIIVQDSGIGISEEHILNIGMPFKQVDMSISRSYEGMGIGLAVTKKILQKLNGEMTVVSETTKGTKVTFTLYQIKIQNDIFQDDYLDNN